MAHKFVPQGLLLQVELNVRLCTTFHTEDANDAVRAGFEVEVHIRREGLDENSSSSVLLGPLPLFSSRPVMYTLSPATR